MLATVVLQALTLLVALALLFREQPHRMRRRRSELVRQAVDEGIALARRQRVTHGRGMTDQDEVRISVAWAKEQLAHHKVLASDAELAKVDALRRHQVS